MNTKRQFLPTLVIGLVVAGAILAAMAVWSSGASRGTGEVRTERVQAAQVEAVPLDSVYAGHVKLDWALPGVYSDTLSTPPPTSTLPDMGAIDLGLLLHRSEDNVTGYVDLDNTLVFTTEHTITATLPETTTQLAVGPYVSGAFDGANLRLESERLVQVTGAEQRLMRQFRVVGELADVNTFSGEYRETVWGYGPQPLTVVGSFTLTRVSGLSVNMSHRIYLPLIRR
jgi:hypothetical protein